MNVSFYIQQTLQQYLLKKAKQSNSPKPSLLSLPFQPNKTATWSSKSDVDFKISSVR